MPAVILALLIIWPVAEVFLIVAVASWLGVSWMLLLLFLSAVAGITILRGRGRAQMDRLRGVMRDRKPPARTAFDGVLGTAGALLLIPPGFISSFLGLALLFPPTRFLVQFGLVALFARRFQVVTDMASRAGQWTTRSGSEYDIDGDAVDVTGYPDDPGAGPVRLPPGEEPDSPER